jgi:hypothetical protein
MTSNELVVFEDLAAMLPPGLNKRKLMRLADVGGPRFVRVTPHSPPLWSMAAVRSYLDALATEVS